MALDSQQQIQQHRIRLAQKKRWVIKIGSALLTNDGQGLDLEGMQSWVDQMAELQRLGHDIILVSSGSVAAGMTRLGWHKRPEELYQLQAAAAVGQMGLVQAYETAFGKHDRLTAQVLLTHDDLSNRTRYLNARSTLRTLMNLGVVPVVNENDTVVTDEICFGDNDTLGALVANLVEADVLVILTDQQGLFTADPRSCPDAELVLEAKASDPAIADMAGSGGALGRGGMVTKVRAASLASRSGADTLIVGGRIENVLPRLRAGELLGTLLVADREPVAARKQWIAGHLQTRGELILDDGAVNALRNGHRSLLPIGVVALNGRFERGEVVACKNERGELVAKGLVNYSRSEANKILRTPSSELEQVLGFVVEQEMIHRDNLVVI
ncbi:MULTISPECIES: glutamate 5-kinase [unclassified Oceanobacter]|jgi:glutamate 5-kinase|uniref:glutamate 5-kinase n=1 Tax=unclassified Oceanobacter TaxID=2620260 RepID=UPI0026E19314|nr:MULTISPECIES: glutamate 5-kinase [unclassified Oceanobacter]MDO6681245.1 glutamate 5-kinase [Oceanobacter sp. 5_MG-2023]MDP2505236.1 glutamate 5-kinase [Oceanobacter sp. 3_MG-2023]